jgi:ketosteroid isomerase-like protein
MTTGNVEIVRKMFDSRARGDLDAFAGSFHPQAEFHPLAGDGRVYHGPEGVRQFFSDLTSRGVSVEVSSHQFLDRDEYVVILGAIRRREPGGTTESSAAWVMKLDEGKVIEGTGYTVCADALAAVGTRLSGV